MKIKIWTPKDDKRHRCPDCGAFHNPPKTQEEAKQALQKALDAGKKLRKFLAKDR